MLAHVSLVVTWWRTTLKKSSLNLSVITNPSLEFDLLFGSKVGKRFSVLFQEQLPAKTHFLKNQFAITQHATFKSFSSHFSLHFLIPTKISKTGFPDVMKCITGQTASGYRIFPEGRDAVHRFTGSKTNSAGMGARIIGDMKFKKRSNKSNIFFVFIKKSNLSFNLTATIRS